MRFVSIAIEKPLFLNNEVISFLIMRSTGPLLLLIVARPSSLYRYIDQSFLSLIMVITFPAEILLLFRVYIYIGLISGRVTFDVLLYLMILCIEPWYLSSGRTLPYFMPYGTHNMVLCWWTDLILCTHKHTAHWGANGLTHQYKYVNNTCYMLTTTISITLSNSLILEIYFLQSLFTSKITHL